MSGDMEQTVEAAVSYRLDNREQKEFNQWFSRSFLKRKKVRTARPDVSNLQEDTKIRMEPGCIHIWSGQKELRLLYSALTAAQFGSHIGHRQSGDLRNIFVTFVFKIKQDN